MRVSLIILFISIKVFTQTENVYWTKAEYSLEPNIIITQQGDIPLPYVGEEKYSLSPLISGYRFLISDLDGDNCPFHPTCSQFFVQAVDETNIFQGTLMFFDRFTRDMNFINRIGRYANIYKGRFYDPPSLYTLKRE